jgi:hypothetical protein
MPRYRVQFFKTLLSSDGHRFKCSQRIIKVDGASPDEAIRAAWQQYDRATNGMAHYCADLADAEIIEDEKAAS